MVETPRLQLRAGLQHVHEANLSIVAGTDLGSTGLAVEVVVVEVAVAVVEDGVGGGVGKCEGFEGFEVYHKGGGRSGG